MKYMIFSILFIMAVQDYLTGEVSDVLYLPLLLLINIKVEVLVAFVLIIIFYKHLEKYIGGADIKIITIMVLIYSYNITLLWLVTAMLVALLYCLVKKIKVVRMFPFFFLSYGIVIL